MWTVVEFNDHSVEAVPTKWVIDNECFWPHYPKEKLLKAMKNCEAPEKDWTKYTVKIFRNATYGNDMILIKDMYMKNVKF